MARSLLLFADPYPEGLLSSAPTVQRVEPVNLSRSESSTACMAADVSPKIVDRELRHCLVTAGLWPR